MLALCLGPKSEGGKGQLAAVAIGALGGAFLGSEVGKSLDEVDRLKAGEAQQAALENNRSGQVASAGVTQTPVIPAQLPRNLLSKRLEVSIAGAMNMRLKSMAARKLSKEQLAASRMGPGAL